MTAESPVAVRILLDNLLQLERENRHVNGSVRHAIRRISLMSSENVIEYRPEHINGHIATLSILNRALAALESTIAN